MKKCEHTLTLKDRHGNIKWERKERKKKICLKFLDEMIDSNLIDSKEPLTDVLIHLEKRPDYGLRVLRAAVRRNN